MVNVADIKGVIFDLDGTLVDSRLDFDAMRSEMGFPEGEPILEHLDTLTCGHQIEFALEVIHRHEMNGARSASIMPGAIELITLLNELHIPTAILTRNMRAASKLMLETLGIPISYLLTREDCAAKPDPEGLNQIAARWKIPSHQLVYVGDYKFDLEVAENANMLSCLYKNSQNCNFTEQADWVISHFNQLIVAFRAVHHKG